MTTIEEHLAPIRARTGGVAKGPWRVVRHDLKLYVESEDLMLQANLGYVGNRPEREAEFIAEARTDVPALLAAVDAALTLAKAYIDQSDRPQVGHDIRGAIEAALEGQTMTWLPEPDMTGLHKIRQEYARARQAHEQAPSPETAAAFADVTARRARAIRTVHREDGASVPHLSAMFRCSKTTIRAALEGNQE